MLEIAGGIILAILALIFLPYILIASIASLGILLLLVIGLGLYLLFGWAGVVILGLIVLVVWNS